MARMRGAARRGRRPSDSGGVAVPAAGTLKTYRQVPWDQENSQSSCWHCGESLQGPGRLDSLPACAKPRCLSTVCAGRPLIKVTA